MAIKIGDRLPAGILWEATEFDDTAGCPLNPRQIDIAAATAGKRIAIFAVPGAFTPTCSGKHLPGFITRHDALKAKGVDEIWCVAVNDAFVMAVWGRSQRAGNAVRMLGDGSCAWSKALGLAVDQTAIGRGWRAQRFSMLVEDGTIRQLNIEAPGEFKVSDADTLLGQLG